MTDDERVVMIAGMIFGGIAGFLMTGIVIMMSVEPSPDTPAKAWKLYMEQREIADQEYARAYGLEDKEGL